MTKRLKTEFAFQSTDDSSDSTDNLVHKNQLDELVSKFAVGFTDDEKQTIQSIITQYPDAKSGFLQLIELFTSKYASTSLTATSAPTAEPAIVTGDLLLENKEISFLKPRKKLDLKIFSNVVQLFQGTKLELTVNSKDCIRLLCLPQKNKKNVTLLLFYKSDASSTNSKKKKDANAEDVLSFNITDTAILTKIKETLSSSITKHNASFKLIEPKQHAYSFQSTKKEIFVDCYFKAKDGQLYFFDEGIFFGMKLPQFIPKESIDKIATNVLSRNFELHILLEDQNLIEFSMINGPELNNISNWVEWNNINNKKKQKEEKKPTVTSTTSTTTTTSPQYIKSDDDDDDTPVVVATVNKNLRRSTRARKETGPAAPPPPMDDDESEDDDYDRSESEDEEEDFENEEAEDPGKMEEEITYDVKHSPVPRPTSSTIDFSSVEQNNNEDDMSAFFAVKR